jgi:hypothetical protein
MRNVPPIQIALAFSRLCLKERLIHVMDWNRPISLARIRMSSGPSSIGMRAWLRCPAVYSCINRLCIRPASAVETWPAEPTSVST